MTHGDAPVVVAADNVTTTLEAAVATRRAPGVPAPVRFPFRRLAGPMWVAAIEPARHPPMATAPQPLPSTPAVLDDAPLVARFRDGDARAFDELVRRHRQAILRLALRYLHDGHEAEDVAQRAFVRA